MHFQLSPFLELLLCILLHVAFSAFSEIPIFNILSWQLPVQLNLQKLQQDVKNVTEAILNNHDHRPSW